MTNCKVSSSKNGFNEDDRVKFRKEFYDIKSTAEKIIKEINMLKLELKTTKDNFRVIKKKKSLKTL